MTAAQLAVCEPTWTDPEPKPDDDEGPWCKTSTPTPTDLRNTEMHDLRYQHAGFAALWTAHTIPTGSYL